MRIEQNVKKTFCFVLPSLSAGGMERVMSELTWYFCQVQGFKVHLILMTRGEIFYEIPDNVLIHQPDFIHSDFSRLRFSFLTFVFLRKTIKDIQPFSILSFGGKYNSFVLLASLGFNIPVFISDRSRPSISYGRALDFLNKFVYKKAHGIIAQTEIAKQFMYSRTNHDNIKVIGNPIRRINEDHVDKENIILNVGRFIPSKQQSLLVDFFNSISPKGWKLMFLGDGPELQRVKEKASELNISDQIIFKGNVRDVDFFYRRAKIFAFTSVSEGFPNALGEAMKAGLACISFDCEAGPEDLIDDNMNGFLIEEGEDTSYVKRLNQMIHDPDLRKRLGSSAKEKMNEFSLDKIGSLYSEFLCKR